MLFEWKLEFYPICLFLETIFLICKYTHCQEKSMVGEIIFDETLFYLIQDGEKE